MTIIVDANILVSAIITPSGTIGQLIILKGEGVDMAMPEFTLEEITLHKKKICRIAGLSPNGFNDLLNLFSQSILLFSSDAVDDLSVQQASALVADVDSKDVLYVAFTIALGGLLWTGDLKLQKALRRKGFTNIVTTKEIADILKGTNS